MILRQKTIEWDVENKKKKIKSNLFFFYVSIQSRLREGVLGDQGKAQTRRNARKGFKTHWGRRWRGSGNTAATKNTELSGSLQKRFFSDEVD